MAFHGVQIRALPSGLNADLAPEPRAGTRPSQRDIKMAEEPRDSATRPAPVDSQAPVTEVGSLTTWLDLRGFGGRLRLRGDEFRTRVEVRMEVGPENGVTRM